MSGLTGYHLKLIAALTMLMDHVGYVFYPDVEVLRVIGRVSFPVFVWLLVQGEAHTKNVWRYGARLGMLALVSQPVYNAAFDVSQLNIL
ncbi:MAG: TraX family protein, partial [Cyanobacteria bacterium J06576_12]